MVVTGMVMVIVVMMMMARKGWHGDHDHHNEEQWQHLFHGGNYSCEPQAVSIGQGKKNHVWQQSDARTRADQRLTLAWLSWAS
jgi:hypothetical protein